MCFADEDKQKVQSKKRVMSENTKREKILEM